MDSNKIRRGMTVYTMDNQSLGTVDDVTDYNFMVGGQQYPLNSGYRIENNNVYLTGGSNYTGTNRAANEMRVPVMEEQLNVEKRQGQLGEVQIHKTVSQEQVNVPVELRREEVNVQQREVDNRPVSAGDTSTAFQEGTIRVPVRGEEAVVNKQAVVTGEVDINKKVTSENQTISDTVRKEQVRVDDSSAREASGVVRNEGYNRDNMAGNTANTGYQSGDTGYATQSDRYQSGTGAAANAAANLREGMDVVGMDGELVGRVKELHDADFRVDRKMKPDINVTYSAIQNVNGDQVVLYGRAGDFNHLI
jgi:uncharacterized protein (TIGR02271 family)